MSDESICKHCGQYLELNGRYTVRFESSDTWEVEVDITPDGKARTQHQWGPKGEDGAQLGFEFEWYRACCGAEVTQREGDEWGLFEGDLFTMD